MGQEQSYMSILEPLSVSVTESPLTCSQRREQIEENNMVVDPELIRAIMAITEQDSICPNPVHPSMGSVNESGDDDADLTRMRQEAETDFALWKRQRRLIKRLSRHDSSTSTSSSCIFEQGMIHSAPALPIHTSKFVRREASF